MSISIMIKTAQCCKDETLKNYETNKTIYEQDLNEKIDQAISRGEYKAYICLPKNFEFDRQKYIEAGYVIDEVTIENTSDHIYLYVKWN